MCTWYVGFDYCFSLIMWILVYIKIGLFSICLSGDVISCRPAVELFIRLVFETIKITRLKI